MKAIVMLSISILGCLTLAPGVWASQAEDDVTATRSKEFNFFKWKITVDNKQGKPELIDTEEKLDKYIRESKDEEIMRARERANLDRKKIERRRDEKIERANYLRDIEIQNAKDKALQRAEREKEQAEEAIAELEFRLRELALAELQKEGKAKPVLEK